MGPSEAEITEIDPLAVEERLSAPGLLAEIDVDLDRWRETDPSTFYPLLIDKEPSDDGFRHSAALGHSLAMRVYERLLDRVRLTLTDAGSSLRLRVELEPLAPGEIAPLPKPAFPSGAIGRVDIAYSSTESSQWIRGLAEEVMEAAEKDGLFADAERAGIDAGEVRALFKEAFEIFWIADAISIAVEPVNGKIVYHQVNQYRSPAGFTERMAAVVKKLNGLDRRQGRRRAGFRFTTKDVSGVRITRITIPGSKLTLDFAESGTTVRIVAAADPKRRLPALLKVPAGGTISSGFSGEFDPNAAVDAYLAAGGHLPFPLRYRPESLRGQLITWSTRAEGEAAAVDFDVPKPLAQAFLQILGSSPFEVDALRL
jgi:hypothetical protein